MLSNSLAFVCEVNNIIPSRIYRIHDKRVEAIWTEYASVDTPADKQVVRGCEMQYEDGGIEQQPDEQVPPCHQRDVHMLCIDCATAVSAPPAIARMTYRNRV